MDNTYTHYLKKQGYARRTIAAYEQSKNRYQQWAAEQQLNPEQASYNDLLDYLAHLRRHNVRTTTMQTYLAAITHYYDSLTTAGIIDQNPARYIELKTRDQRKLYPTMSKDQLENLYTRFDVKALRKTKTTSRQSAIRNKIATGLMVYQGLDVNTLSSLKTENIDVLGGTIQVPGSRKHNPRNLALQARQIIELDRYINQTRAELQHQFRQEESDQLLITGYTHYYDAHRRLMQRLKKQEPQLQSVQHIRSSVIVHWLRQHNLREVQYMAGHKNIQSTEAYQQDDTESLQLDIDRFHPMNETED